MEAVLVALVATSWSPFCGHSYAPPIVRRKLNANFFRKSVATHAQDERRLYYCLQDGDGLSTCTVEIASKNWNVDKPRRFVVAGRFDVSVYETSFYEGKLGSKVWPCGIATATWCAINSNLFVGKKVLELGAGVGLAGLVCAAANATVVLTDLDAKNDVDCPSGLVPNLQRNIHLNGLRSATARRLDWRDDNEVEPCDIILCSDCVYYPENVDPLARTIKRHLAHSARVAYVVTPLRDWSDAKYPRATAQDLLEALMNDGDQLQKCRVSSRNFASRSTLAASEPILLSEVRLR